VSIIVQSHGEGELWGLATHPAQLTLATVSDDKSLRIWDIRNKRMLAATKLKFEGRGCNYSPDGKLIAVGLINGTFEVFETDSLKIIVSKRNRSSSIDDLKFSPDGKYLAVGSHDNFVDIYETTSGEWKRTGVCKVFIVNISRN
jgi:WD40 repeat protein